MVDEVKSGMRKVETILVEAGMRKVETILVRPRDKEDWQSVGLDSRRILWPLLDISPVLSLPTAVRNLAWMALRCQYYCRPVFYNDVGTLTVANRY
jgi:hypothetical protein